MDTFFARNRLSAYLDGDLPSGEARDVEAALNRDPELRAEYEQLRGAVDFLRSNGPIAAPEGFANRLHIRIAAEPPPSRLRSTLRRVRFDYVGIAAVAAMALIFVGTRHDDPVDASTAAPPTVAVAQAPGLPEETSVEPDVKVPGAPGPEAGFATTPPSSRSKPVASKSTSGTEREAFQAEWERDPPAADGSLTTGTTGSATQTTPVASLYSPAPWRYRVHVGGTNPLKELMDVASSLGGRIVDAKGRPLADYPMDEGDSQAVRVYVPSYNVEALQRKLKELGTVDTIATDPEMLYQNGAEVPVSIEVQR